MAHAACASQAYYAPPHPVEGNPPPTVQPQQGEIPAQAFTPEPHQARKHPRAVAASMASLPALVRSSKCVSAGSVPEGRPNVAKPTKKKKKSGSFVRYADAKTAKDKPRPSAPKVEPEPAPPSKPTRTPGAAAPSPDDAASGAAPITASPAEAGGDDAEFGSAADMGEERSSKKRSNRREKRKAKRDARRRSKEGFPRAPCRSSTPERR